MVGLGELNTYCQKNVWTLQETVFRAIGIQDTSTGYLI